jgi:hypothetical protein
MGLKDKSVRKERIAREEMGLKDKSVRKERIAREDMGLNDKSVRKERIEGSRCCAAACLHVEGELRAYDELELHNGDALVQRALVQGHAACERLVVGLRHVDPRVLPPVTGWSRRVGVNKAQVAARESARTDALCLHQRWS